MQRNPFLIVKEYVQPGEPAQVRKNALTALAVLQSPESLKLLSEVALAETDAEVREMAEAEIAELSPEAAAVALEPALNDLTRRGHERRAYGLLGRLRNRGIRFPFPGLPLMTRLRLAGSLRNQLYPARPMLFYFRTFWGATVGTVLAWLATVLLSTGPYDLHMEGTSELGFLLSALSFGVVLAMAATTHTIPTRYHPDATGGALFDIGVAAAVGLPLAGLAVLLLRQGAPEDLQPLWMFLFLPATAAAIRLGTLAAFAITKSAIQNRLLQITAGGTCGLAVYEWCAIASGKIGNPVYASTWAMVMVVSFALAGGYAWIDAKSSRRPVTSPSVRRLTLGLCASGVLVLILPLIPIPPVQYELGQVTTTQAIAVRHVPAEILFETVGPLRMYLSMSDSRNYTMHLQRRDSGKWLPMPDQYYNAVVLAPGAYRLNIEHHTNDISIFYALPGVAKLMTGAQLRARLRRKAPATGLVLDQVTLAVIPSK
jgi:hypothetical protein